MSANTIFNDTIPARLNDPADRENMLAVDAVFQINLTGDEEGSWHVDLKEGMVGSGEHANADCTITMDSEDFVTLYEDSDQGPMFFMGGKIEVDNPMLAMQLMQIMG